MPKRALTASEMPALALASPVRELLAQASPVQEQALSWLRHPSSVFRCPFPFFGRMQTIGSQSPR
jgi:hypothetical protein